MERTSMKEELDDVLSKLTFRDEPMEKEIDRPSQLLKAYLFKSNEQFRRVLELRHRGWHENKEKGDAHFGKQRQNADNSTPDDEKGFFKMMEQIAVEMDNQTGALSPPAARERVIKVLDLCMAPGGYSSAILNNYPTAEIYGITLSAKEGGHAVLLRDNQLKGLKAKDITFFAMEFVQGTGRTIPKSHPDYKKFDPTRPFNYHKMDIVFCDGMVLRTHARSSYREKNEAIRLATSQLILGLQRIIQGGTLIMLLLKVDSWASANIVYTFSKFAAVELFKPAKKHSSRGSFYMIAKNVDVESPAARTAIAEVSGPRKPRLSHSKRAFDVWNNSIASSEWKTIWFDTTFGGNTEGRDGPEEEHVLQVIKDFGPTLMRMGGPIWSTQADALSRTDYAGKTTSSDPRKENVPPNP